MTIREVTALRLLYLACKDPHLRARVLAWIPELRLLVEESEKDQIPEIPPDRKG